MMPQLYPHLAKIDVEVLTVLIFLLVSFGGWLKDKLSSSSKKKPKKNSSGAAEKALRELIWRRQMGEENLSMPWETKATEKAPAPTRPEPPVREATPPPIPATHRPPGRPEPPLPQVIARSSPPLAPQTSPPPIPQRPAMAQPRREVSLKEAELARSFEGISRTGRRRRGRNKAVMNMLRRPESARQAILLQEILGPPVSLRSDPELSR